MQRLSANSRGFTIVELVVAITVMGLLLGLVLNTLGDYFYANTTSLGQTVQDTDTRTALRAIENELANTSGFAPSIAVASPLGKNNGTSWDYTGDGTDQRVLIAYTYATTRSVNNDPSNERLPILVDPGNGSGCPTNKIPTPDTAGTPGSAMKNVLIYFTAPDPSDSSVTNLYRRTIVNPEGKTVCPGGGTPAQKTTCKIGVTTGACANPSVVGTDALLVKNVSSFKVNYFSSAVMTTPISGQYTGTPATPITDAMSADVIVTTNYRINGKIEPNTATIRITRPY